MNEEVEEISSGVPIEKMATRLVGMHSQGFSPLNCQVKIKLGEQCSFYSLVKIDSRCCLCYHIISGTEKQAEEIERMVCQSDTLGQLISNLSRFEPMKQPMDLLKQILESNL